MKSITKLIPILLVFPLLLMTSCKDELTQDCYECTTGSFASQRTYCESSFANSSIFESTILSYEENGGTCTKTVVEVTEEELQNTSNPCEFCYGINDDITICREDYSSILGYESAISVFELLGATCE